MGVSPNIPLKGQKKKIQKVVERVVGIHWVFLGTKFEFISI